MHLLIPMSGQGTRYQKAGYIEPKPMISVNGKPMIERLMENFNQEWITHFVIAENHVTTGLPELLKKIRPSSQIHIAKSLKKGPGYAIEQALPFIPKDAPVLVSYCDYAMIWNEQQFKNFVQDTECDACVISYRGFHAHYLSPTNYAFSKMQGERVLEIREKHNFTDNRENEYASSGGYYFKTADLLNKAIIAQKENDLQYGGEYYTSLTVQALFTFLPNPHIRIFEIPGFFQWGAPEDLVTFEYWEKTFKSYNKTCIEQMQPSVNNLILPMAGLGSRFQSCTSLPKPLIPLEGQPMFKLALKSVPAAKKNIIITKNAILPEAQKALALPAFWVGLDETPPGQALTTEVGLNYCHLHGDVLVTACDHSIALSQKKWQQFITNSNSDAAIFTIKGFPGTLRTPNSFSYVLSENSNEIFPKIISLSIKKPFTDNPRNESLLVGTFWFNNAEIIQKGITWLKEKNLHVNNELYLDSIFIGLIEMGYTVCEIPLDGYINWGDPNSLKEALYWKEIFMGRHLMPRPAFPGSF